MAKARKARPVQPRWDRQSANAGIFSATNAIRSWYNARHNKSLREALLAAVKIDAPSGEPKHSGQADQNSPIDQIHLDNASVWANVFVRVKFDAPVSSYEIDAIALDYCARGLLPFASQVIDEYKIAGLAPTNGNNAVWLVRKSVVIGAYCGIYMLEDQSKMTERLQLTKSHFEDLQVIKARIRRDELERIMIRRRDGGDGDEIRDLFKAFEQIDIAIDNYLKAYEPKMLGAAIATIFQAVSSAAY